MTERNLMKHRYLKKMKFYSHLNMDDITDADYVHDKKNFYRF